MSVFSDPIILVDAIPLVDDDTVSQVNRNDDVVTDIWGNTP